MVHILISFLTHWLLFCFVACLARWILLFAKYPASFSVKDLVVLTFVIALISGILHVIGFVFFKEYMELLFNNLHYIQQ